jgi:hypothetical protein
VQKPPETVSIKLRADRQETEEFYLTVSLLWLSGRSAIFRERTNQLLVVWLETVHFVEWKITWSVLQRLQQFLR